MTQRSAMSCTVIFPKDFSTDEIIALMSQYREIASIDT